MIAAAAASVTAAGAARLAYSAMNRRPPGDPKAWSRTNHRGEPVTLLEGPAVTVGAIGGVLAQAGLASVTGVPGWRHATAMALGGAGAAAFGAYDDLAGSGDRRGFRGHLGALRHGEVTTGAVKLGGIGATGIVSAALAGGPPVDVIINAGLVAGGANLLNLFDLRPGRAIKVAVASGALIGAASVWYSRWTAAQGAENLNPYGAVQFGSILVILAVITLFPPRYSRTGDVLGAAILYALAKVAEHFDGAIFLATGGIISGHTLKHLLAAAAAYWLLRMLMLREPMSGESPSRKAQLL